MKYPLTIIEDTFYFLFVNKDFIRAYQERTGVVTQEVTESIVKYSSEASSKYPDYSGIKAVIQDNGDVEIILSVPDKKSGTVASISKKFTNKA